MIKDELLLLYLFPFKNSMVGGHYVSVTNGLAHPTHSLLFCEKETKLKGNSTE